MPRLSWPIENIKRRYEVVVVGSGYGGAIAASRVARAGRRVCVLERGREWQPGEYPDTLREAMGQLQVDGPHGRWGSPTGLYDFRMNEEIDVFMGCGLGGTSLVNAGVALPADRRTFDDARWPAELRDPDALEDGYNRAIQMLRPASYPDHQGGPGTLPFPPLPKLTALEKSARYLATKGYPANFYRPPIDVHFGPAGPNHVGVYQQPCKLCGDCVSGCNYAAKNTLIMNYLPDARNHGAEIYTRTRVERLEQRPDGRWLVHFQLMDAGREKFDAPTLFVMADLVVLGAGALGSTEILLRSRDSGLAVSETLGHRFTGNGDVLAIGYNTDDRIDGIGYGARPVDPAEPVGPCITGIIDLRQTPEVTDGFVIEEGSPPGALSGFLPEILAGVNLLIGQDQDRGFLDFVREKVREWGGLFRGRHSGALRNTQTYLVMSHDDGKGTMELVDGRLRISWRKVGDQPIFATVNQRLKEATAALGGTFDKDPLWTRLFQRDLITVHPLGGCVMADHAGSGVVNERCQVFSQAAGTEVYENLYVMDGSVIPRPLGVNPLLTISAVAERSVALLARDRGWTFEYDFPGSKPGAAQPQPLGIEFTETMRGAYSTLQAGETPTREEYERAAAEGVRIARDGQDRARDEHRAASTTDFPGGGSFEFTLTITTRDFEAMVKDPDHSATMVGTVRATSLSDDPLTVTNGRFNLFMDDPDDPKHKRMRYRMNVNAEDGSVYSFEGFKEIKDDPGADLWADTTTLFITIREGQNESGPPIGLGVLRIRPKDFMRQLTTMRALGARGVVEAAEVKARFGRLFVGELQEAYGALLM
jgi:cholesterol oxidase